MYCLLTFCYGYRKICRCMSDIQFETLIRLYLIGKKIKSIAKKHNYDQVSRAIVLWQLKKNAYSISELAKLVGIKPSAMSEKIRLMEEARLIREVQTSDARKRSFTLTEDGESKWYELKEKITVKYNRHCLGLTKTETHQLLNMLGKINLECV